LYTGLPGSLEQTPGFLDGFRKGEAWVIEAHPVCIVKHLDALQCAGEQLGLVDVERVRLHQPG